MTSTQMLSRLRTLLDENSAGFWTDTECYNALSDGQREVINILFKVNPYHQGLKSLLKTQSAIGVSGTAISLPSDFKELLNATWSTVTGETQFPCNIKDYDTQFLIDKNNTYLAPHRASPVVYIKAGTTVGRKIYFEPASTGDYTFVYLTNPPEIDGSTNPILPVETHEPIIVYAFSFLLRKDLRGAEADGAYKLFLEMASKL